MGRGGLRYSPVKLVGKAWKIRQTGVFVQEKFLAKNAENLEMPIEQKFAFVSQKRFMFLYVTKLLWCVRGNFVAVVKRVLYLQ